MPGPAAPGSPAQVPLHLLARKPARLLHPGGKLLARLFELNPNRKTPAYEMQDGLDYEPLTPSALFPQHFSAIAAAGPIVGPIVAGMTFGWLPALKAWKRSPPMALNWASAMMLRAELPVQRNRTLNVFDVM